MLSNYKLGGKEYPFKVDLYAWENYEELTGESFLEIRSARIKNLVTALYVGLVRGGKVEDKEFTLSIDQLREQIHEKRPADLLFEVMVACGLASDEEDAEQEEETEKKQ